MALVNELDRVNSEVGTTRKAWLQKHDALDAAGREPTAQEFADLENDHKKLSELVDKQINLKKLVELHLQEQEAAAKAAEKAASEKALLESKRLPLSKQKRARARARAAARRCGPTTLHGQRRRQRR